jgi:hypothetical protein
MNELSWYEDTKIKFTIDGGEVILTEADWLLIDNIVWYECTLVLKNGQGFYRKSKGTSCLTDYTRMGL